MPEQSDNGFIFYTYIVFLLVGLAWSFMRGTLSELQDMQVAYYSFGIMLLYTIIVKTRLLSLKYVSSSTYFINYRVLSSLWLLLVGIVVFSETITLQEILGVFLWFIVFYLLIEKKDAQETKKNLQKGFFYLFIGSLCITALQSLNKWFIVSWWDVFALITYGGCFGMLFTFLLKWKETISQVLAIHSVKYGVFLLSSGVIFTIATITNNLAYISWDLAVVYKIISYSLFIPIILSIIIYKEHVSLKKLIAFILTLVSILLFI